MNVRLGNKSAFAMICYCVALSCCHAKAKDMSPQGSQGEAPSSDTLKPAATPAKDTTTQQTTTGPLNDYFSFAGLSIGDHVDKVDKLFPKPDKVVDDANANTIFRYYGNFPDIDYEIGLDRSKNSVVMITVTQRGLAKLKAIGITDEKFALIGSQLSDIQTKFGPETAEIGKASDLLLAYDVQNTVKDLMMVQFAATTAGLKTCGQISVIWTSATK